VRGESIIHQLRDKCERKMIRQRDFAPVAQRARGARRTGHADRFTGLRARCISFSRSRALSGQAARPRLEATSLARAAHALDLNAMEHAREEKHPKSDEDERERSVYLLTEVIPRSILRVQTAPDDTDRLVRKRSPRSLGEKGRESMGWLPGQDSNLRPVGKQRPV
jgi:hypothetical protein